MSKARMVPRDNLPEIRIIISNTRICYSELEVYSIYSEAKSVSCADRDGFDKTVQARYLVILC